MCFAILTTVTLLFAPPCMYPLYCTYNIYLYVYINLRLYSCGSLNHAQRFIMSVGFVYEATQPLSSAFSRLEGKTCSPVTVWMRSGNTEQASAWVKALISPPTVGFPWEQSSKGTGKSGRHYICCRLVAWFSQNSTAFLLTHRDLI